jgi:glycosyltransferase involved in cell wall biosynthesis
VPADGRTRVIYVTARLPFADGEPFIVPEIVQLVEDGCDVTVVPVRTGGDVAHADALRLVPRTARVPLLSGTVLWGALVQTVRAPASVARAFFTLRASRSVRIFLKNLAVFPKAVWLARHARGLGAEHIHAHWASTPATVALIAAQISDVPWSLTAHRWDIAEDNLLRTKARRACFVRVISAHGAEELRGFVGDPEWSPWLLYVGVRLPAVRRSDSGAGAPLRVLTAARLVEEKGHVYLLEAVRLLKERRVSLHVELAGDGPLDRALRQRAAELGVEDDVLFLGRVSHEALLTEMSGGRWDVSTLPSIVEGLPISLVEAMACGVPAVGTETGGVPELLGDGAGLLVHPRDAEALADALELLSRDATVRASFAQRGRARVEGEFSVERIAAALHARFRDCSVDERRRRPMSSDRFARP